MGGVWFWFEGWFGDRCRAKMSLSKVSHLKRGLASFAGFEQPVSRCYETMKYDFEECTLSRNSDSYEIKAIAMSWYHAHWRCTLSCSDRVPGKTSQLPSKTPWSSDLPVRKKFCLIPPFPP